MKIAIASPQETVPIDRQPLRRIVQAVLAGESVADAEISLAFVDNATIHQLNKRYLNHDEPTDILTFPLSESSRSRWSPGFSRLKPGLQRLPNRAGRTDFLIRPYRFPRTCRRIRKSALQKLGGRRVNPSAEHRHRPLESRQPQAWASRVRAS